MYLKELRLNGFKSFADETFLALEPGLTAIVGPNGCGKTNIADAIRWVLGEQKTKSLRAGTMQDVIFQGSDTRKPVNLCEVSLVFTECENDLKTSFHEVEVARRLNRDGNSDYSVNGKSCRLRDIQHLFMDTGIGRVSYSFMLQGQIDQILSSNPVERRAIFEEAAGISRYKAQRKEAFNKLALVDSNLARVTDVMEEVARQIGSLRRQAGKALRYKRIKHRLTNIDLAGHGHKYGLLRSEMVAIEEQASELRGKINAMRERLLAGEAEVGVKKPHRADLYESLQRAQQTVFDLRSEKEQAESQSELSAVRADDQRNRLEQIRKEQTSLRSQKEELADQAASEARRKGEQLEIIGCSDQEFQEKSRHLAGFREKLALLEKDLQQHKQDLLMRESHHSGLRCDCTDIEVDLKTCQARHTCLNEDILNMEKACAAEEDNLKNVLSSLVARCEGRKEAEDELKELRDEADINRKALNRIQEQIQEIDRGIARISARAEVLKALQENFEGFGEGAKSILQGKLDGVLSTEDYKLLTRHLHVEPVYAKALEALLGSAEDTIALSNKTDLRAVTERLETDKLGRACLQIPAPPKGSGQDSGYPEWLRPALEVVSCDIPEMEALLKNLFTDCYFCERLRDFLGFWEENREFEFLLVATTQGDLVDRRGLVYAGHGAVQAEGYWQRDAEIKRLGRELSEQRDILEIRRSEASKLQDDLDESAERIEEKRRSLMETVQEISTLETQEGAFLDTLAENRDRIGRAEKSLLEFEDNKTDSATRLERANAQLAEAEAELANLRQTIAGLEQNVTSLIEEREAQREGISEARLVLAEKRQRLDILDRGIEEIEAKSKELDELQLRREQEIDTLRAQIEDLEREASKQRARATEIEKTLQITLGTLEETRRSMATAEKEINDIEESMASLREEIHTLETDLNRLDIRLAQQRSELNFLLEEVRREYDIDLDSVDWRRELWLAGEALPERIRVDIEEESPDEEDVTEPRGEPSAEELEAIESPDWTALSEEINSLRSRLHAMGPINLIAIEEYSSLKERHLFLKTQSEDLHKSKDRLLAAIDDINKISLKLFETTFEHIRKNFQYTFDILFGGGEADLKLIDTDDVLESGIDITARPPGTRLKTLVLLSGGQKALTAVALLFAVYMVKPSPFCLLDELDAPLDDANVGRFTDMLKRFLKYSQFLIITHNKRTIGVADSVYGITMQEKGVSKVISMRLDKKPTKAAEPKEVEAKVG